MPDLVLINNLFYKIAMGAQYSNEEGAPHRLHEDGDAANDDSGKGRPGQGHHDGNVINQASKRSKKRLGPGPNGAKANRGLDHQLEKDYQGYKDKMEVGSSVGGSRS